MSTLTVASNVATAPNVPNVPVHTLVNPLLVNENKTARRSKKRGRLVTQSRDGQISTPSHPSTERFHMSDTLTRDSVAPIAPIARQSQKNVAAAPSLSSPLALPKRLRVFALPGQFISPDSKPGYNLDISDLENLLINFLRDGQLEPNLYDDPDFRRSALADGLTKAELAAKRDAAHADLQTFGARLHLFLDAVEGKAQAVPATKKKLSKRAKSTPNATLPSLPTSPVLTSETVPMAKAAKKNARRVYDMSVLPGARKEHPIHGGKVVFWTNKHGISGLTEAEAAAVWAHRNWENAAASPWGRAHRLSWEAVDGIILDAGQPETGEFAKEVAEYGLTAQEAEAFAIVAAVKDRLIRKKEKAIKAEIKAIEKAKGK